MFSRYSIRWVLLVMVFAAILLSCGFDFVINESKSISHLWFSHQPVEFEFEVNDTVSPYSFTINIRNNTDYGYSNIYFFINTIFPDGQSTKDTVECILANVRGKWLGKGMGNIKESSHLIRDDLYFPMKGNYKMKVEQAMREEALEGIEDVGIQIIKKVK